MGFPVLHRSSSCIHAVATTPAEPMGAFCHSLPHRWQPSPDSRAGRLPPCTFRGLLSVHSRYSLHTRETPYRVLYTEGFSRFVTSTTAPITTGWSDSCRVGFAPTERPCLCTAHRARRDRLKRFRNPAHLFPLPVFSLSQRLIRTPCTIWIAAHHDRTQQDVGSNQVKPPPTRGELVSASAPHRT